MQRKKKDSALERRLRVAERDTMTARIIADMPPWLVEAERVMQAKGQHLPVGNYDMMPIDTR